MFYIIQALFNAISCFLLTLYNDLSDRM